MHATHEMNKVLLRLDGGRAVLSLFIFEVVGELDREAVKLLSNFALKTLEGRSRVNLKG